MNASKAKFGICYCITTGERSMLAEGVLHIACRSAGAVSLDEYRQTSLKLSLKNKFRMCQTRRLLQVCDDMSSLLAW